jgi:hypothetical protein
LAGVFQAKINTTTMDTQFYDFTTLCEKSSKLGIKVLFSGLTAHLEDVTKWKEESLPCGPGALFQYVKCTEDGKCEFFSFVKCLEKQLFYVTVSYANDGSPADKGGYLMAQNHSTAMQIASDKVRAYPTTTKIWGSEASLADSNGLDFFTFEQSSDFWDNEEDTGEEEEEE